MPHRPGALLAAVFAVFTLAALAGCDAAVPAPAGTTATAAQPAATRDPVADLSRITCDTAQLSAVPYFTPYIEALLAYTDSLTGGDEAEQRRRERAVRDAVAPWAAVYREYAARDIDPRLQHFFADLADDMVKTEPSGQLPDTQNLVRSECTRFGYLPAA
ncbi:hypothetical protein [Catellatospora sp. NPDC049133]|uniref:hypothetical protein n=1 Tax=Catellatospora sp. NPDC049133 TaxID=3155499 RepID=UPI0033D2B4B3